MATHHESSSSAGMSNSSAIGSFETQTDGAPLVKEPPRVYNLYSWSADSPATRLVYIQNPITANLAISQLNADVLGFDLEWRPNFIKGRPANPVALVQLASEDTILLIHLTFMHTFPEKLRELLLDPIVVKAGVGIQNDCRKLYLDYGVDTRNCVDLSLLARTVDNNRWKGKYSNPIGLARLCETYEELTLSKGKVQTSNWERPLDLRQQEYAANDAHVGFVLYKRLAAMASEMLPVPQKVWYSFDTISGLVFQPSSGIGWHPINPFYDPGPPPPPKQPKPVAEGNSSNPSTVHGHLQKPGGRFPRHNNPSQRPLSPAAFEFVPGSKGHSPSSSPSPIPRFASNLAGNLWSIPGGGRKVTPAGFSSDRDGSPRHGSRTWDHQPRAAYSYGAGHVNGQPGRGRGRGRDYDYEHAVAARSG